MKKGTLRDFAKFKGKRLCQSLFFNKVTGLRPATLLKKRPWHRCFPVNFARFLRTTFSQNTSERLFLKTTITLDLLRLDVSSLTKILHLQIDPSEKGIRTNGSMF